MMVLLSQRAQGFRYTSDSLFLVDFISSFSLRGSLLDVGCGCGVIGLLLARHHPEVHVSMVDIEEENCEITRANGVANHLDTTVICHDFLTLSPLEKYDTIVSNPPYYPSNTTQSPHPHLARSRYESFLPLEKFLHHASRMLKPHGQLIMCHHPHALGRVLEGVKSLRATHLQMIHPVAHKDASLVMVRYKKDSKDHLKILPPRIVMENGSLSLEAKKVYQKFETKSIEWKS